MDASACRHRADARARPPSLTGTPGLLGELPSLPHQPPAPEPVSRPRSVYAVPPPFLRAAAGPSPVHKPAPYKPPILPLAQLPAPQDPPALSVFSSSTPFWVPHRDHPQQPLLAPQRQHYQQQEQPRPLAEETAEEHDAHRPRALTDHAQKQDAAAAAAAGRRGSLPSRVAPVRRRGSSAKTRTPPVALVSPRTAASPGTSTSSRRSTCEDVWCDAERDLVVPLLPQDPGTPLLQKQQQQQQQPRHERQRSVSLLPAPTHPAARAAPSAAPAEDACCSLAALLSALPPPSAAAQPVVVPAGFCDGPADLRAAVLNPAAFDVAAARGARFFVIKAPSERDVLASVRHGVWATSDAGARRLASALHGPPPLPPPTGVYLFFSVNGSGQFCGVAQLVRALEPAVAGASGSGSGSGGGDERRRALFGVRWLFVKNVPNSYLRHIRMPNCDNRPVTNCRDAQELLEPQGHEMLAVFYSFCHSTSLLDAVLGPPAPAPAASAQPYPRSAHSRSASSKDGRGPALVPSALPLRAPLSVPSSPAPPALSPLATPFDPFCPFLR